MFSHPIFEFSTHERILPGLWLAEGVATLGLLMTIHSISKSAPSKVSSAVALYIGAAYWFTSSTSFANPAVTVARMLTDSFAGISPASVPGFILAQLAGLAVAVGLTRLFAPES